MTVNSYSHECGNHIHKLLILTSHLTEDRPKAVPEKPSKNITILLFVHTHTSKIWTINLTFSKALIPFTTILTTGI